ncbi:hypothetical protein OSB04_016470 [Centaurea solstitialis]|uniref:Uncharacterized protein n=1 Tax=Centaurea solstitialis TaxID=347529 RepID=A0AA38WHG7_9ASTR|nr:hypothetical protein OSB04_016470 [Centaurea solstitialis]
MGALHIISFQMLLQTNSKTHEPVAPFGVEIGYGTIIWCSRICKDIPIQVDELKITQNFHPFPLGGVDLVLGIQWLATLNTVQANWKEMFMIFKVDGKQYKLQGITSGPQKSSSFQHLVIDPEAPPCIPTPFQPIVTQYMAVFDEPQDLPPIRSQDHCNTPFSKLISRETYEKRERGELGVEARRFNWRCLQVIVLACEEYRIASDCQVRPGREKRKFPNETPRLQQFSLSMEFDK